MLWKSIMILWGGIRSCSLRAKLSRRIFPGSRIICHKGFRSTLDFCPQFLSEKLWNRPRVGKLISSCLLKYSAFFHLVIFQHSITTTDLASLFWEGSLDTIHFFLYSPLIILQSCWYWGFSVPWRVVFQVMKQVLINIQSRYVLGPGSLPPFPPALLIPLRITEYASSHPVPVASFQPQDLPVWSISGPSVPWLGEFSSTWGKDRRLEVIKSLLNYLMQDWLACLPPWLSSWASKQLRKQPFSKSWTRRKISGMKDFCRRHLAQLEERFG